MIATLASSLAKPAPPSRSTNDKQDKGHRLWDHILPSHVGVPTATLVGADAAVRLLCCFLFLPGAGRFRDSLYHANKVLCLT